MLLLPPSMAPRSWMPFLSQKTARISGKPGSSGSIVPLEETPAIKPLGAIQLAALLVGTGPGSAPKSALPKPFDRNACETRQSLLKQIPGNGSGVENSAEPVTVPRLFSTGA